MQTLIQRVAESHVSRIPLHTLGHVGVEERKGKKRHLRSLPARHGEYRVSRLKSGVAVTTRGRAGVFRESEPSRDIYIPHRVGMFRGLGPMDPKGPTSDSRLDEQAGTKTAGVRRGQHRGSLCSPGLLLSCDMLLVRYDSGVGDLEALSCFVTDNAPRDAFVAAPLSVLSVSLFLSR